MDMCCQSVDNECVVDREETRAFLEEMNKTLVYTDGREIYSINLVDGIPRKLARSGE